MLMYSWTRSGFHGSRSSREAFQVEEAAAAKAQGWEKWGAHLGGWQESRVEGAADVCGGAEGGLKPQARNPLLACWPSGSVGTDPPLRTALHNNSTYPPSKSSLGRPLLLFPLIVSLMTH